MAEFEGGEGGVATAERSVDIGYSDDGAQEIKDRFDFAGEDEYLGLDASSDQSEEIDPSYSNPYDQLDTPPYQNILDPSFENNGAEEPENTPETEPSQRPELLRPEQLEGFVRSAYDEMKTQGKTEWRVRYEEMDEGGKEAWLILETATSPDGEEVVSKNITLSEPASESGAFTVAVRKTETGYERETSPGSKSWVAYENGMDGEWLEAYQKMIASGETSYEVRDPSKDTDTEDGYLKISFTDDESTSLPAPKPKKFVKEDKSIDPSSQKVADAIATPQNSADPDSTPPSPSPDNNDASKTQSNNSNPKNTNEQPTGEATPPDNLFEVPAPPAPPIPPAAANSEPNPAPGSNRDQNPIKKPDQPPVPADGPDKKATILPEPTPAPKPPENLPTQPKDSKEQAPSPKSEPLIPVDNTPLIPVPETKPTDSPPEPGGGLSITPEGTGIPAEKTTDTPPEASQSAAPEAAPSGTVDTKSEQTEAAPPEVKTDAKSEAAEAPALEAITETIEVPRTTEVAAVQSTTLEAGETISLHPAEAPAEVAKVAETTEVTEVSKPAVVEAQSEAPAITAEEAPADEQVIENTTLQVEETAPTEIAAEPVTAKAAQPVAIEVAEPAVLEVDDEADTNEVVDEMTTQTTNTHTNEETNSIVELVEQSSGSIAEIAAPVATEQPTVTEPAEISTPAAEATSFETPVAETTIIEAPTVEVPAEAEAADETTPARQTRAQATAQSTWLTDFTAAPEAPAAQDDDWYTQTHQPHTAQAPAEAFARPAATASATTLQDDFDGFDITFETETSERRTTQRAAHKTRTTAV